MAATSSLYLVQKPDLSRTGKGVEGRESTPDQGFQIARIEGMALDPSTHRQILDAPTLYSHLRAEDGRVIQAIGLIAQCTEHIAAATKIDPKVDFIGYDEELMRAKDSLRKLFALREIGDGFGAVISSILCAITNGQSSLLNGRQFSALLEVLKEVRKRPMLHFDSATTLLEQLEDSDLNIEPPFIDALVGFLDE